MRHALDFQFSRAGSLCILTPLTRRARKWAAEFLPEDAAQYASGTVIEVRYMPDILRALQAHELVYAQA